MYLSIARKWRPQHFKELIGQDHVVQTLTNAIQLKRVSHAYLFSGARGVGKTSVARIFAKALRCQKVENATPCDKCTECLAITESRSVDVVEIDGASNNGVESVRALRENVVYGAATGFYKIYIIDEVHMLSVSAFNALLKTLEEPPPHVIFLFATTEQQKIPLTILSRCQRFEFRRLNITQLFQRLHFIASEEGQKFSDDGLRTIAAQSDGSLRDALSLLDQVFSFYGSEKGKEILIDDKKVIEALGISPSNQVLEWLSSVFSKDAKKILALVGDVYASGIDLKHFAERCLEEVRLLYLIKVSGDATGEALDMDTNRFKILSDFSRDATLVQIERMAQILLKTTSDLGWCALPRFVMEMASVRISELDGIEATVEETVAPSLVPSPSPPVVSQSAPPPLAAVPENSSWKAFVDAIMKKRPLLGALLSHAQFKMDLAGSKKKVSLSFEKGSFYEKQATEKRNKTEIESMLKQHFGAATEVVLGSGVEGVEPSLEQKHQAGVLEKKQKAMDNPMVKKGQELLGAEIVDIHVEV